MLIGRALAIDGIGRGRLYLVMKRSTEYRLHHRNTKHQKSSKTLSNLNAGKPYLGQEIPLTSNKVLTFKGLCIYSV
jgi:hypothetical protein